MNKSMLLHRRDPELSALLRALEGKPVRANVEIRPLAVCGSPGAGPYVAAISIGIDGGAPPRIVYGSERFVDKHACEAHAIRVANDFARCRSWDNHYSFTVTTQGMRP